MLKRLALIAVGIFVLLTFFLRVYKINEIPIELFGDEIDVGLQGYSIATTGKDYLGNKWPVFFHSFSEYRYPMQLYMSALSVKFFGLNEVGVRTPSIVMGAISIAGMFFLIRKLFGYKVATVTASFMLISPWHFNFSRQANDAGILLPFIIFGTYFFIKSLKDSKYILFSSVFFALSVYTYAIAVVFTPLYVIVLAIIFIRQLLKINFRRIALSIILGFVILIPFIQSILAGISSERYSVIAVNSGDSVFQEVVNKRRWSNSILTRIFYNTKSITFDRTFTNYLSTLSTDFLFTKGDPNMRQGIEGFGQMYRFDIPLLIIGGFLIIYNLTNQKTDRNRYYILLAWLVLAPIPSSLTKDGGNHASRLILMLPPLITISAIGMSALIQNSKKNIKNAVLLIFSLIMIFETTRFFHRYFIIWPNESWRFWQSGFKETLTYVKGIKNDYSRIVFNNTYEPMLPRFLFYFQYDMNKFQDEFTGDVHVQNIVSGLNGFSLGEKYYFGELQKPIESLAKKDVLVVASAEKDATNPGIFLNGSLKLLKQTDSPTKLPIFYVFTKSSDEI